MRSYSFDVAVFDMDGVITKTARVHSHAWKRLFDGYLRLREKRNNEPFREFTHQDYLRYVDGKPRLKGIASFLESRNIHLPEGSPDDAEGTETIYALGNTKNAKFREALQTDGVEVYEPTIELIRKFKDAGIKVGVVSSSKNCEFILRAAGVLDIFQTRVDGVVAEKMGLEGKPEGDIFVTAALNLESIPSRGIVFEDAISGVQAGKNGGFGLVVGVARSDNIDDLHRNGADVVVTKLTALDLDWMERWFCKEPPSLFNAWKDNTQLQKFYSTFKTERETALNPVYLLSPEAIFKGKKKVALFLDYDGTLTPIVDRPELAVMSGQMRERVRKLSQKFTTAIVSGRMRENVEELVGIKGLFYAGSHGFDILGEGVSMIQPKAEQTIPVIHKVIEELKSTIGDIQGVIIEEKKFSVAVHYRLAEEKELSKIKNVVEKIKKNNNALRLMHGKKVFEILPAIDWNKGKAVRWIMKALNISWEDYSVVYIGDDTTDEDAFRVVNSRGAGILVSEKPKQSAANFQLATPAEVGTLFERLVNGS